MSLSRARAYLGFTLSEFVSAAAARNCNLPDDAAEALYLALWDLKPRRSSQQRYQDRHRQAGLCIVCTEPSWRPGASYCKAHRAAATARQRKRT